MYLSITAWVFIILIESWFVWVAPDRDIAKYIAIVFGLNSVLRTAIIWSKPS